MLFAFTLIIVFVGLALIGLGQPPQPQRIAVWSDDVERKLLRDRRYNGR